MSRFHILVADAHPVFRLGVGALLGAHDGWNICGEAADGRDAVEKCRRLRPDLLILDICMRELNGLDAVRQILRETPDQRILVLTDVESEQLVRECLEAGIRGWVLKSDGADDLVVAVEALQHHKCAFTPRVSDLIMDGYLHRHRLESAVATVPQLSPREREVVQLVCEGRTTKEIAVTLLVSGKTVETHRTNIMFKLKLHSIAELVLYAVRNEIVHVQLPSMRRAPHPERTDRWLSLAAGTDAPADATRASSPKAQPLWWPQALAAEAGLMRRKSHS